MFSDNFGYLVQCILEYILFIFTYINPIDLLSYWTLNWLNSHEVDEHLPSCILKYFFLNVIHQIFKDALHKIKKNKIKNRLTSCLFRQNYLLNYLYWSLIGHDDNKEQKNKIYIMEPGVKINCAIFYLFIKSFWYCL